MSQRFHYDVRPIVAGLAVTFVFTLAFHFAATLFPTDAIQMWLFHQTGQFYDIDNPIRPIQFGGGLVGGGVAGYLTRDSWIDGGVNGLFAAVLGVGSIFLLWSLIRFVTVITNATGGQFPLFEVFLYPLIFLFPFFVVNLVEGLVGGLVGYLVG